MKFSIFTLIISFSLLTACQNEDTAREQQRLKNEQKREITFETVNKSWNFTVPSSTEEVKSVLKIWPQWNELVKELQQKPKSSINAFRKKAITLSKKAEELNNSIPEKFNNPQVKSRISILIAQLHSLDLYINLDQIPSDKVVALIPKVNKGLQSLDAQFQEILRKEKIPLEQGEADMIRMLDTTRAIPSSQPIPSPR